MQLSEWKEGEAREVLAAYAGMVNYHATRLRGTLRSCALDQEDLVAVGRVAVLEGVGSFTGEGEMTVRSWVSYRVRQRMVDTVRAASTIKKTGLQLMRRLQAGEVLTGLKAKRALQASGAYHTLRVSEDPMEGVVLEGGTDPEAETYRVERGCRVREAMVEVLTDRQAEMMELRLAGLMYREIGARVGVTEACACLTVKAATRKLTNHFDAVS